MEFRLKILAPVVLGVVSLWPSAGFAQEQQPVVQPPNEAAFCSSLDIPIMRTGELLLAPPDAMGRTNEGVLNYSAVRGQIVHVEGPLVLLRLDQPGTGNVAPNRELAGDMWAVVELPEQCSPAAFPVGSPMVAIGEPSDGILHAVEAGTGA